MTRLDNMESILQHLQLFRDRVYSALYHGDPKKSSHSMFFDDDNDDYCNTDDQLPLFQIIKAIQQLIKQGEFAIAYKWMQSFLCRVERTVRGMPDKIQHANEPEDDDTLKELYFVKPWKLFLDESQHILTDDEWLQDDDDKMISIRYTNVKNYEDELKRRKIEFESTHGRQKTFRELCKKYHSYLVQYLVNCIMFHSSISIQSYNADDNYFETVDDNDYKKTEEFTKNAPLRSVEMSLRPSASRVFEASLSSSITNEKNRTVTPFIPSQKETFVKRTAIERDGAGFLEACRWILILGDPGCGKTTLLRWIMLKLVRLIVQRVGDLNDVKEQLDKWQRLAIRFNTAITFRSSNRLQLPILIRTSELISWLHLYPNSTIMDYIGYQTWLTIPYVKGEDGLFLQEFIHHGHAFLLFDGLDEVSNYNERKMIVDLIEKFAEKYVRTPAHISINDRTDVIDEWGSITCEWPKYVGGNQIIITSRVIGYYLYPIKSVMFELFTLNTMDERESHAFIDHWLTHIPYSISRNQSSGMSGKSDRIIRKNKEMQIKTLLYDSKDNVKSHPMLLSLILPILYRTPVSIDQLQTRIRLYDLTIQYALKACIDIFKSDFGDETIYWLLYDMAFYIHTRCPSGLVDTFDLTHLFYVSLGKLYENKRIYKTNEWLKHHAQDFVSMLTNNSIGFAVARGLDAFGFSHLTFQEYFVALSIVKPYTADIGSVIDRLSAQITKPTFREPLILAMEWININWNFVDFDRFCLELLEKVIGPFPIGAIFLSSVLGNFANVPGLHILSHLFNVLMASSTDRKCFQYLVHGLIEANAVSLLIEHLFHVSTAATQLCQFFALSLVKDRDDYFVVPDWLSKTSFLRLEATVDTSENLETMFDSIFYYMNNKTIHNRLYLSSCLIETLATNTPIMHPAILSLLIVLCGGLHHFETEFILDDYKPEPIQFDASRMHRSTPLSGLLLTYFTNDQILNSNERFEHLIEQCHKIIVTASAADVSRRVVDAFVALICLRGLSQVSFYEQLLHYRALARALYRMRLVLYRMRKFYRGRHGTLFQSTTLPPCAELSKFEGCQILEKFILNSEVNIPTMFSSSTAICAAFSRLLFHEFSSNVSWNQPLPISLSENKRFLQNILSCSAEVLHLILNPYSKDAVDDATKWNNSSHPFQLYSKHPLFSVGFISSKLRPVFERLASIKQSENKETIPFVVILAEVLLSLDETSRRNYCDQPLKILLVLRVLERDIHQYQLHSYAQTIIHDIKTETNYNDWHFNDCDRGMTPVQSEDALKLALNRERERIHTESDIQLFTASIGLVRIVKSLSTAYNDLFEEANTAALSIRDPILQILCLRHMREIVRSHVDTKYYHIIQNEIVDTLKNLSLDDTPLTTIALIFGTCAEELLDPSMERLLNFIWQRLQHVPACTEERLNIKAIIQVIKHTIGHRHILIPLPLVKHSGVLQLNSPVFHTIFQNMTLNSSETILMAQLYLAEVTVDAQILTQFTQSMVSPSMSLSPTCIRNTLRNSWKSDCSKFPHRQIMLINSLILSSSIEFEDIPFEKLRDCMGFEEQRDRPVVESWLKYHDDEHRLQFALLAVFLLVRSRENMTPRIRSIVELVFTKGLSSKTDSVRQGAHACFSSSNRISWQMCYREWSTPMWCLLRNLMVGSLGSYFTLLGIGTTEQMKNLLEAERQRLCMQQSDDPYSQFSLLSLIDDTLNNDGSDIQIHLSETLMTDEHTSDVYIAFVIFHIVRNCEQKEWCNKLFELLHNLLYNTNLPNTQLAAIYALASQKKGRKILLDALNSHFNPFDLLSADDRKFLSESQLVACMVALTDTHDEIRNIESLNESLKRFWQSVETKPARVQHHFQACLLSHLREENDRDLSIIQSWFNLTYQDVYNLYMINTSYFALEWKERMQWISKTAQFIISHSDEVLSQFVIDLYMHLTVKIKTNELQNPQPNCLAVAHILAKKNSGLFCQAIRNSDFGEEAFKYTVYLFNKRGITIDEKEMCLELYASFQILSEEFIEMIFDLCLQDFSIYQSNVTSHCEKTTIANREDIDIIFSYLESSSIHQRRLAMSWLINLVKLDILSFHEVQLALSEKNVWKIANENGEFGHISEWYRLMCLKPIIHRGHFSVLQPDVVETDFSEVIDASYLQFM